MGILADSHGLADKLRQGIETLRDCGAEKILHLGDAADTLRLETVDQCIGLMIGGGVSGVMGNHEYSLVMHHFKRYPERFSAETMDYVRSLPWRLVIDEVCFTHFSPLGGVYGLFAPTDDLSYEDTMRRSQWKIIINGHSHDPRIYRQANGRIENIRLAPRLAHTLDATSRYILTCGALQDSYCALFDSTALRFELLLLK